MLQRMFSAEQVGNMQKANAEKSEILEGGVCKAMVFPFARGELVADRLMGCTYRHVVKFLDHPEDKLTAQEWRVASFDWFSSDERARSIQKQGISARTYAQALMEHKNIIRAEDALLNSTNTTSASTSNHAAAAASSTSSHASSAPSPVSSEAVGATKAADAAGTANGKPASGLKPWELIQLLEQEVDDVICQGCSKAGWWRSMYCVRRASSESVPAQEILEAVRVPQDDSEELWKKVRQGSLGSSPVVPMGYSKYDDNTTMMGFQVGLKLVHTGRIESTLSISNDILEHEICDKEEAIRLMSTSAYCSTCVSALHANKPSASSAATSK